MLGLWEDSPSPGGRGARTPEKGRVSCAIIDSGVFGGRLRFGRKLRSPRTSGEAPHGASRAAMPRSGGRRRGVSAKEKGRSSSLGAVGERLRAFRKGQSLTQNDLARAVSIHFQSILRYEKGLLAPGSDFVLKLSELFRLNPNWLLLGEGPMFLSAAESAPRPIAYDDVSYAVPRAREPFTDYRAFPPPNALVETADVPVLKTLQALVSVPPKKSSLPRSILLPRAWLMHPDETCAAAVETDALRSTLRRGDLVVLDWSDRGASAADGGIVAAVVDKRVVLKRFALTPMHYFLEDDDSPKPLMIPKADGCPVVARCLFVLRRG